MRYFHYTNKVHRDLKPDNLLFRNGEIVVADFGFAKQCESIPQFSAIKGTIAYQPSGCLRGTRYKNQFCHDIYSVGVIFYEMLFGTEYFVDLLAKNLSGSHAEWADTLEKANLNDLIARKEAEKNIKLSEPTKNLLHLMMRESVTSKVDDISWLDVIDHPAVRETQEFTLELV